MPSKHALLSASKAERWLNCPPSMRLELTVEKERTSSPYAEEGTRAHALCEMKLKQHFGWDAEPCEPDDDAMDEYTTQYVDFVVEEYNENLKTTPDAKLFVELELKLDEYVPEGFGTSDAVIVSDSKLEVIDFKYGQGITVKAKDNPQLMLYALGSYLDLSTLYCFDTVKMTIFQPRIDNIDSYEIPLQTLIDWAENVVKPTARMAFDGEGEYRVGDHCKYCDAAAICRARAEEAFNIIDAEQATPPLLDDSEIPAILDKLDATEAWIKAIRQYALDRAVKDGVEWKGYKIVAGQSRRKITDPIAASKRFEAMGYALEDYTTTSLKGITELEKLCGKKVFNEKVADLVVKPEGAPKLVAITDKRPAISPLASIFSEE